MLTVYEVAIFVMKPFNSYLSAKINSHIPYNISILQSAQRLSAATGRECLPVQMDVRKVKTLVCAHYLTSFMVVCTLPL